MNNPVHIWLRYLPRNAPEDVVVEIPGLVEVASVEGDAILLAPSLGLVQVVPVGLKCVQKLTFGLKQKVRISNDKSKCSHFYSPWSWSQADRTIPLLFRSSSALQTVLLSSGLGWCSNVNDKRNNKGIGVKCHRDWFGGRSRSSFGKWREVR